MAFMMGGGIWLRSSGLVPDVFIAVFYTGLGCAPALAGVLFWVMFAVYKEAEEWSYYTKNSVRMIGRSFCFISYQASAGAASCFFEPFPLLLRLFSRYTQRGPDTQREE